MKCCECISMKKDERLSSMKIYFHGFRGLGRCPKKQKMHFVCTNALLAK